MERIEQAKNCKGLETLEECLCNEHYFNSMIFLLG
jgi:hypothetical protein